MAKWAEEIVRREIEMAKQHRRANKPPRNENLKAFQCEVIEEEIAADRRQKEENTWPVNDYVLGAALMLVGAIVLIAIAVATGLVKP